MEQNNPFGQFELKTSRVMIEALGQEVTLKSLSIAESDAFSSIMFKDAKKDEDGTLKADYPKMVEVSKRKMAACLVDPVMTYEEIIALPESASVAVNEVIKAIAELNGEVVEEDDEGNLPIEN